MFLTKAAARREMRRRLSLVPRSVFREAGREAALSLRESALWRGSASVLVFLSMEGEIDTAPLLRAALEEGKKVFAPRVEAGEDGARRLRFHRVLSADGPWERGPLGTREPSAAAERFAGDARDCPALVLTPGLAFDRAGGRLGRGGGFYDRFFAELDNSGAEYTAAGLCLPCQREAALPRGPWDKPVSAVWESGAGTEAGR